MTQRIGSGSCVSAYLPAIAKSVCEKAVRQWRAQKRRISHRNVQHLRKVIPGVPSGTSSLSCSDEPSEALSLHLAQSPNLLYCPLALETGEAGLAGEELLHGGLFEVALLGDEPVQPTQQRIHIAQRHCDSALLGRRGTGTTTRLRLCCPILAGLRPAHRDDLRTNYRTTLVRNPNRLHEGSCRWDVLRITKAPKMTCSDPNNSGR